MCAKYDGRNQSTHLLHNLLRAQRGTWTRTCHRTSHAAQHLFRRFRTIAWLRYILLALLIRPFHLLFGAKIYNVRILVSLEHCTQDLTLFSDKLLEPISVVLNSLPMLMTFAGDWVGDGRTTIPVPAGM